MKNVSTYHSRRPHRAGLKMLPVRLIWPRSTANTPIWQVTLDSSRTVVLIVPRARFRWAPGQGSPWLLSTERIVKYIANSAAKNISSDDSQTIVPTLTRFGRLAGDRGGVCGHGVIITTSRRRASGDPPCRCRGTSARPRGRYDPLHEGRHLQP